MFVNNRSARISICDRLKQRYGDSQGNWEWFSKERNNQDFEYIQYVVNFIIEQAKHSIVISELPEVIRTLHSEAEAILRKNRMITLPEVITQMQLVGAMKYPYLKKLKPISTDDFVKEVMREVFDRLGTIITLDMIENICRFTTCSAKQLLQAMPTIDVNEAATLIIEDISRNQRDNQIQSRTMSIPLSPSMPRKIEQKSTQNINKNHQDRTTDPTSIVKRRRKTMKKHASLMIETEEKISNHRTRSKSNTQTYSIHSEEGLFLPKCIKQTSLHTTESSSRTVSTNQSSPQMLASTRHYNKYCYQHSDISDNEEQITENCPLEDILHHRFLQST